jgi:hypothetical protein
MQPLVTSSLPRLREAKSLAEGDGGEAPSDALDALESTRLLFAPTRRRPAR